MLEIPEHFERLLDDFSRTPPFDIHDKTYPTRVMLKSRVVESLLLGNKRLFHSFDRFDNGQNKYGHQLNSLMAQATVIEPSTTTLRRYCGVDYKTVIR